MPVDGRARVQGRLDVAVALAGATGGLASGFVVAGTSFDRDRMAAAAADELVAATDVADLLVRKGTPFREAHGIVGELVRRVDGRPIARFLADEIAARFER